MRKYSILFTMILVVSVLITNMVFAKEETEITTEPDPAFLSVLVDAAVEVLAEKYNSYYWSARESDEEYRLDIRSTRVFCIKDKPGEVQEENAASVQEEFFGDIQYVVEFLAYSDSKPSNIYSFSVTECVILYDNGTMEWGNDCFRIYRNRTFSSDFSTIIEQVIDFHEEYNQVICFQNNQIYYERTKGDYETRIALPRF